MSQKTTIAAIVFATIMAASAVVMALPFESTEASNTGGDARSRARSGDAPSSGGVLVGGSATSGSATRGDATGGNSGAATGGNAE
jgi:hypothetical protein